MARFDDLNLLTEEERLAMIASLTQEIDEDEKSIEDGVRSDEEAELRNDIKYNKEKREYLVQLGKTR